MRGAGTTVCFVVAFKHTHISLQAALAHGACSLRSLTDFLD